MIISLVGDIALNGLFVEQPEKNDIRFKSIAEKLQKSDFVLANLETPIKGDEGSNKLKKRGGVILYSTKEIYDYVLPKLNLSAVSLANNHIFDWGKSGVGKTISCLDNLGIKFTGAGFKKSHVEPVIIESNKRIAFLSYVHKNTNPEIPENSGIVINFFNENKILAEISKVKNKCDIIILSLHWGIDYSYYPTSYQRLVGRKFIDAGVDIILGHHTHTLQPFEIYKDGIIFYSLGSICHGDFIYEGKLRALKRKTKKSMIVNINQNKKIVSVFPTKELIGNRLIITNRNLVRSFTMKLFLMKLKHKVKVINTVLRIKEIFFDRFFEYFFGYYRNPVTQLFTIKNLKKIKYMFRDYFTKNTKY